MTWRVMGWIAAVAVWGWLAWKAVFDRRPLKNCEGCAHCENGCCLHPEAREMVELPQIMAGQYMCPYRAGRK